MPTPQQNTTSAGQMQVGDLRRGLAEHEPLVHWVVHRQWLGGLPYVEAVQEGRIALWRALCGYDRQRGCRFSSYAVPVIARAVWRAVAVEQRTVAMPAADPRPGASDLEAGFQQDLVDAALHDLVARLPDRLATVIESYYGLAGREPQTFRAIGRRLGVTRQRVQQLHVEAVLWLADPVNSVTLRRRLDQNTVPDYRRYLARRRAWQAGRRGSR